MTLDVTEKVKARRQDSGLKEADVAKKTGLSVYEYRDIEQHANEIFTVTELHQVKKLCEVLNFDFADLFEIRCAFCEEGQPYLQDYSLPRNELIRKRREEMGLSREEMGDRVGFYESEIENLETNPDHLETWPMDFIKDLSNEINAPLQVLLNVKCKKCGR